MNIKIALTSRFGDPGHLRIITRDNQGFCLQSPITRGFAVFCFHCQLLVFLKWPIICRRSEMRDKLGVSEYYLTVREGCCCSEQVAAMLYLLGEETSRIY